MAQVNYVNIGLMILSAAVALFLPFELFLFSYIVLGPLHYLTEIAWLHKRQYFSPGRRDIVVLLILFGIAMLPTIYRLVMTYEGATAIEDSSAYKALLDTGRIMLFVSFAASAAMVFTRDVYKRITAIIVALVVGFLFRTHAFITILFALFIPTLVHVFLFTGAFILVGALKSRSVSGVLSLVVFLGCAVALFLVWPSPVNHSSQGVMHAYSEGFARLNKQIFATFLHRPADPAGLYYSPAGIIITRFIAYAYTYHYLNWFSKTSVIRWHQVPRRALIAILLVWAAALAIYFANYATGVAVLYFLSVLHVVVEFPLNFQSFKDIGREMSRLSRRPG